MSDSTATESGRTALRVAAVVLLVLVVAPFVVTGVPSIVGAEESFVVLSGSMNAEPEPVIQPGDVVIVAGVDPANIAEGDIITFTTGREEPVTHRVVDVTQQDGQAAFRTKGDANEDADPQLVGSERVVGEVMFVIPLIGHVVGFANTTQGFVLLVLVPISLLVLSEVWNLVAPGGSSEDDALRDSTGTDRYPPFGQTHAVEAEVDAEEAEEGSDEDPSTVTLGKAQAKWSTVGLVPVAVAGGYAAFRLQTAWILTVFFASVGLCLLSGLVYLRIRWGPTGAEGAPEPTRPAAPRDGGGSREGAATTPTVATVRPVVEDGVRRDPVVTGRIEGNLGDSHVEVSVDSREKLVEMAIEKRTWVVRDTETGTYVLVDDGMVFQYGEGSSTAGAATNWEGASGWITYPDTEDGGTTERESGSDAVDRDGEEQEREGTTEDVAEPTGTDTDGSSDTDGRPGRESTPVDVGEVLSSGGDSDEPSSGSARSDEDVTPVVRRIDDGGTTGSASDSSSGPDDTDGATTESSVRADGGETDGLPMTVRVVGQLVDVPIRALGFVGYLTIEPPMALYRALRPDGRENEIESRPQFDGRSEREP